MDDSIFAEYGGFRFSVSLSKILRVEDAENIVWEKQEISYNQKQFQMHPVFQQFFQQSHIAYAILLRNGLFLPTQKVNIEEANEAVCPIRINEFCQNFAYLKHFETAFQKQKFIFLIF